MEQWLSQTLAPIITPDGQTIVLSKWPNGSPQQFIAVADAATLFTNSGLSSPFTHAQAAATALYTKGGWNQFFDAWQVAGYIS